MIKFEVLKMYLKLLNIYLQKGGLCLSKLLVMLVKSVVVVFIQVVSLVLWKRQVVENMPKR